MNTETILALSIALISTISTDILCAAAEEKLLATKLAIAQWAEHYRTREEMIRSLHEIETCKIDGNFSICKYKHAGDIDIEIGLSARGRPVIRLNGHKFTNLIHDHWNKEEQRQIVRDHFH